MTHYLRPIYFALILIAMSTLHTSFSMIKENGWQQPTETDQEAICLFAENLAAIDPIRLIMPENYDALSCEEQAIFSNYRSESLADFLKPYNLILNSENPDIRVILIHGCAHAIDGAQLERWSTHNISSMYAKNVLAYIKDIAQEALKIKMTPAPKNNPPANCPQLPNINQPLSFFAKCSIAAGVMGTAALVYYWYTTQKEAQKA